jgi:hypothetical protein
VPGVTAVQEFTDAFRTEHRQVRTYDDVAERIVPAGRAALDAGLDLLTWAAADQPGTFPYLADLAAVGLRPAA